MSKPNMSLKRLLHETNAWDRNEDGSLPTLKDVMTAHQAKGGKSNAVKETEGEVNDWVDATYSKDEDVNENSSWTDEEVAMAFEEAAFEMCDVIKKKKNADEWAMRQPKQAMKLIDMMDKITKLFAKIK